MLKTLVILFLFSLPALADGPTAGQRADLEAKLDSAMKAYNAGEWRGFFENFSASAAPLATEAAFREVYLDKARANFGTYESREAGGAEAKFAGKVGLLVYPARFSLKPAKLSVNLVQESNAWKFSQVRIDP